MFKAYKEHREFLREQDEGRLQNYEHSIIKKRQEVTNPRYSAAENPNEIEETDPNKKVLEFIQFGLEELYKASEYNSDTYIEIMQIIDSCYRYSDLKMEVGDHLKTWNFVDIAIKMLQYFDNVGLFSSDSIWKAAYYTLKIFANYTDVSIIFATECLEKGMISMMAENISYKPYLDNLQDEKVATVIDASLVILMNLSKVENSSSFYEQANVKVKLEPFLTSTNRIYRLLGTMILTAIIKEEENAMLEDTDAISFIIAILKQALTNSHRKFYGFSTTQMTECLGRMAVNDNNKSEILEKGALPGFVEMMQNKDENEQYAAARTIWTLSFDKEVKIKLKEEPNCLDTLEELAEKGSKRVSKMARGALWIIQESKDDDTTKKTTEPSDTQQHIFISYNWNNQDMAMKIRDKLKSANFPVWIDVDQMGGSTMEAMASAVENATVVLILVSEKYKNSPNTRTEGEYTFQLRKPIIPLMLQRNYKPDGWLGLLMGSKFYINFDGKFPFDTAFTILLRELRSRNHDSVTGTEPTVTYRTLTRDPVDRNVLATQNLEAWNWSKLQVSQWLSKNNFSNIAALADCDGSLLLRLNTVRLEAPEFFYNHLEKTLQFNTFQILQFIKALDSLQ